MRRWVCCAPLVLLTDHVIPFQFHRLAEELGIPTQGFDPEERNVAISHTDEGLMVGDFTIPRGDLVA